MLFVRAGGVMLRNFCIFLISFIFLFYPGAISVNYKLVSKSQEVQIYNTSSCGIYPRGIKIFIFPKNSMSYGVSLTKPEKKDFILNSNFFTAQSPIGLVVIDGKQVSSHRRGGGYFYIKKGIPSISTNIPHNVEYASQTILMGIRNGAANTSILKPVSASTKTYRSLFGEDKDGNFILIVTGNYFSLATIEDMINIGLDFNIKNGLLFDGGPSVEYGFTHGSSHFAFKGNEMPDGSKIAPDPMVYIHGLRL